MMIDDQNNEGELFALDGKVALVTGASGGLGAAITRVLLAKGAICAASGTRMEKLDALAASAPGRCVAFPADLSDRAALDGIVPAVEAALGRVDLLINNAGRTRDGLSMRMKDADWDEVLEIDLTAAFRLSRAVLKGMMKRRHGRIINITSVVGVTGNPGQANYCAAKAGLIGMTKSMAREVANRGITVNAVAPGFIDTEMTEKLNDTQRQAMLDTIPAGRFGAPADVAAACLFLSSAQAAYVTGQTLHVNGGMAMI